MLVSVIVTVVMFLIMISLHEFGHFIIGKLLGFNVLEYAIGFGPVLFKKRGKNTLYSFRLIPFGGFCQFDGEDEQKPGVKGAFNEQKCWKRFFVLFAGAAFNVILGFIVYFFLTMHSGEVYTNTINNVIENTALYEAGVQQGDIITEIDGHNVGSYRDIQLYAMDIQENIPVSISVRRGNDKKTFEILPTKQIVKVTYGEDNITYTETIGDVTQTETVEYSDKNPFRKENVGKTQETIRLLMGFSPTVERVSISNVFQETFNMTCFVVKLVYKSLFELVTGGVGIDQVSGPVGVVSEVNTAVRSGSNSWLYVLNIAALLTINLGVMNLLPLPALDGGRILFVIIEWIRRKPVSRDKEGMIHAIGFAILFAFMIFIFFQDIIKLFR